MEGKTITFLKKKELLIADGCAFLGGKGPPSIMSKNTSMLRCIIVKFQNGNKKEKVLKASRKKEVSVKN